MTDTRKLLSGIILVAIGLVMFVSLGGFLPALGVVVGLVGLVLVVYVLFAGKL